MVIISQTLTLMAAQKCSRVVKLPEHGSCVEGLKETAATLTIRTEKFLFGLHSLKKNYINKLYFEMFIQVFYLSFLSHAHGLMRIINYC